MKLQSLADLEKSIGGRPKRGNTKARITFYLSKEEVHKLRYSAEQTDRSISEIVRKLVVEYLS